MYKYKLAKCVRSKHTNFLLKLFNFEANNNSFCISFSKLVHKKIYNY